MCIKRTIRAYCNVATILPGVVGVIVVTVTSPYRYRVQLKTLYIMKTDNEYKLTVEFYNGQRYCYYGKTKKQAIAEFKRNFGSFRGFVKKEWELV